MAEMRKLPLAIGLPETTNDPFDVGTWNFVQR
jgi:hypothetical protein